MNDQIEVSKRNLFPRILVSTQNVAIGGGVVALISFLGPFLAKERYGVTYVFPTRSFREMFGQKQVQIREVGGIKALQVRSIPYLLLIDQLIAAFTTRRFLKQYDIYQAIGGANLPAIPFMMAKKPYVCWVATTIKDEDLLVFDPLCPTEFSLRTLLHYFDYLLRPLVFWYEKRIYQKAAKILVISQYTACAIQKQYAIPAKKISVIRFPIDTERFKPDADEQNVEEDFILMVGRITDPRKNIKLLLKSFAKARQSFPDLNLVIIGKRPENDHLSKFCVGLGIENSVSFLGHAPEEELIRYYRRAKLFVLPSLQEGLGIVVLEAMACGTPVVSTRCGGPEEIITHGESGYLVENDSSEDLAHGICKLLKDDELRAAMGKKARDHICRYYSLELIGPEFIGIYKEIYPDLFNVRD